MLIFIFCHPQRQGWVCWKSLIRHLHTVSLQPPLYPINTIGFPESLGDAVKCFSSLKCRMFIVCGFPTDVIQACLPLPKQSTSTSLGKLQQSPNSVPWTLLSCVVFKETV